jgi:hypothetical protein
MSAFVRNQEVIGDNQGTMPALVAYLNSPLSHLIGFLLSLRPFQGGSQRSLEGKSDMLVVSR